MLLGVTEATRRAVVTSFRSYPLALVAAYAGLLVAVAAFVLDAYCGIFTMDTMGTSCRSGHLLTESVVLVGALTSVGGFVFSRLIFQLVGFIVGLAMAIEYYSWIYALVGVLIGTGIVLQFLERWLARRRARSET